MFKRTLNRCKDYLSILPSVERNWINNLKGKISCLLYHRIEDYGEFEYLDKGGSPVTSPDDFEREISYLMTLPVKFYTFDSLQSDEFPNADTVGIVICFDDCFKSNYRAGMNILDKHSIPAVFFQCSRFIDNQTLIWEHALYWFLNHQKYRGIFISEVKKQLKKNNFSDHDLLNHLREKTDPRSIEAIVKHLDEKYALKNELKNIAEEIYPDSKDIIIAFNNGHEIACHGHNHYKRQTISQALFEQELQTSQSIVTRLIGEKPISFSYPFNSYLPGDHNLVNKYFSNIATVEHHRLEKPFDKNMQIVPRLTWPGRSNNPFRMKRWLLTGSF